MSDAKGNQAVSPKGKDGVEKRGRGRPRKLPQVRARRADCVLHRGGACVLWGSISIQAISLGSLGGFSQKMPRPPDAYTYSECLYGALITRFLDFHPDALY